MTVRSCPGSLTVPPAWDGDSDTWCWACGRTMSVRNDGTIQRHKMDWARYVSYMAEVVDREACRDGWGPWFRKSVDLPAWRR